MSEPFLYRKLAKRRDQGNLHKRQYIGILEFGTPAVKYSFLFDSGSTKTWIKDRQCRNCLGKYNTSASRTFKANNVTSSVSYADGTRIDGSLVHDTVSLNGLTVENYEFILASSIRGPNASTSQYQGISGFGPTSQSNPSLFSYIFQGYPSLPNVVAYFIDRSETKGRITLGGIDTSRFSGPLAVQDIVAPSGNNIESFLLPLDSIKVGKSSIPLAASRTVLIDTGTSLTVLPNQLAADINKKLNFISLGEDFPGLFGTYCPDGVIPEGLPNITITMGNVQLKITPDVYTFLIADTSTSYCVSGIQGSDLDYAIIGNIFLRRYYTVFDLFHKRIGFATCNRDPLANSTIIAANLSQIVVGIADPSSVFGETSSESFGHSITCNVYGLLILIFIHVLK